MHSHSHTRMRTQLLRAGRTVVAGLRGSDKEAAVQMFEAAGCVEGRQKGA